MKCHECDGASVVRMTRVKENRRETKVKLWRYTSHLVRGESRLVPFSADHTFKLKKVEDM